MVVNIAIIGLGYWGPNLLRNFLELEDSEVHSILEIDQSKREAIIKQKKNRGIKLTSRLEDVLNDPNINAVVIATPTRTHYELTRKALEHGKHVLVEKPLTLKPEESLELITLAEELRLTLMVSHTFLYNPVVRFMREEIRKGNIGDILYMHATRTSLGPIRQDVNVIWDLAPHDISIFNFLLNQNPENVSAEGRVYLQRDRKIEDVAFLTLDYQNNVIAGVKVSWIDPIKTRNITVVGSQRMIVFDDTKPNEKLVVYEKGADYQPRTDSFGEFQLSIRDGDIIIPRINIWEPLRAECAHFLHCIQTGERPLTDGKNGYAVVAALSAAEESLRTRSKVKIKYDQELYK